MRETKSITNILCNFCEKEISIDSNDKDDWIEKTKGWKRLYCAGKSHHNLDICPTCMINTEIDRAYYEFVCPLCSSDLKLEKDTENGDVI